MEGELHSWFENPILLRSHFKPRYRLNALESQFQQLFCGDLKACSTTYVSLKNTVGRHETCDKASEMKAVSPGEDGGQKD